MVKSVIFDLDGTLIQTEVLKANSYAIAIHSLTKQEVPKEEVLNIFNRFVGLSRHEVVAGLLEHFKIQLGNHLGNDDPDFIGDRLIDKRLAVYRTILADNDLLSKHFCQFTLGLFHQLHADGFQLVLATMSHLPEAKKVTETMDIYDKFDLVLTRDDVLKGKPQPDIYIKALQLLNLKAHECLVIEDSVNGILAAQNVKIPVFAVTNSITKKSVHDCGLLASEFIVDDLEQLRDRVYKFIASTK